MKCNLNTAGKRGVLSDGFFSGKINYMCEKLWQSEGKWAEGEHNRAQGTGTNQRQLWSAARVGSSGEQQPEAETSDLASVFPLLAVGRGQRA